MDTPTVQGKTLHDALVAALGRIADRPHETHSSIVLHGFAEVIQETGETEITLRLREALIKADVACYGQLCLSKNI